MTTYEIRALISTKIAGQGSMVDVGGGYLKSLMRY